MDITQSLITVAGFIGLGVYQRYKIKSLKDQTNAQTELLKNIGIYSAIIDPKLLKYRIEQYEKLIEKEKSIELHQAMEKLSKDMDEKLKRSKDSLKKFSDALISSVSTLVEVIGLLPHEQRKSIISGITDNELRKTFERFLPRYEELDEQKKIAWQMAIKSLTDFKGNKSI